MTEPATRPTWAEIDLAALRQNVAEVRRLVGPERKIIAAIKGDAYGHGSLEVAVALSRCPIFGLWTGSVDEAIGIRAAGVTMKIILFGGYLPSSMTTILAHDLVPTIYDLEGARAVSAVGRPAAVYVKVDAGLGRLGVALDEAPDLVAAVAALPNLTVEGVYTHLPFKDEAGARWAHDRLLAFKAVMDRLEDSGIEVPVTQALASSAVLAGLDDGCNTVCVGHLLFGLSPLDPGLARKADFRPVLSSIKSRLIQVAHRATDTGTADAPGYGLRNDSVAGVLPLGLSDGMRTVPRGKTAHVLLRGHPVPIRTVNLEHTVLALDGVADAAAGEVVTILGEDGGTRIDTSELARALGCSPLELVMSFAGKLHRQFHGREG